MCVKITSVFGINQINSIWALFPLTPALSPKGEREQRALVKMERHPQLEVARNRQPLEAEELQLSDVALMVARRRLQCAENP